jgi:hypothetical protein
MPGHSTASRVGKPVASKGPTPGVEPRALEPATAASLPPVLVLLWLSDLPAHPASASATKAIRDRLLLDRLLITGKVSPSPRCLHPAPSPAEPRPAR